MSATDPSPVPADTEALLAFIDAAPSPYHAAAEAARLLAAAGFQPLDPAGTWPTDPGRWYVIDGGGLVAWAAGPDTAPDAGFRLVGAHTDSPNLRVKARPDTGRLGWRQIGVEVYGGALVNSWLDRDLGVSGRVAVRAPGTPAGMSLELMRDDRPLFRVPQLAIHLDREIRDRGLQLNPQQHLAPVWGLGVVHEGAFRAYVADALAVDDDDVLSWDLMFHDLTPSTVAGARGEFVSAPRLDNLCSAHGAVRALLGALDAGGRADVVPAICLFDHEEVGSVSGTGAGGTLLPRLLERSVLARGGDREAYLRALAASVCVSADMAHATHPNYPERHEPDHPIALDGGPVIKVNANQRYASDARSAATFRLAAEQAGVPVQEYVHRTDLPCGSTIGPITAAQLGIPTVDVGVAQLAMHSARELAGSRDPARLVAALTAFLAPTT